MQYIPLTDSQASCHLPARLSSKPLIRLAPLSLHRAGAACTLQQAACSANPKTVTSAQRRRACTAPQLAVARRLR